MTANPESRITDRLDVVDTCTRMAWHADHREWDELATIFDGTVRLDYTSLDGGEPITVTPAQIVTAWRETLGGFDATQHLLGNHLVTVDGDRAVCTASFQATHRKSDAVGGCLWTLAGTYHFDLVRACGAWKISGVVMTATWGAGNRGLLP
ncbi:nuclear transport factor 2 family protein [Nocardia carnea]|uniref:nuclear transport factor 2 family protein n=1 Tax=Nocardia carnea TaxID=37328 RepID=UPI00245737C5|nr:nuclear transport factor 2 family protein [Nocardia carnea]